jgi:GGDEF domain-containing protein
MEPKPLPMCLNSKTKIGPFGVRNTTSLDAKVRRAVEQYGIVSVLFLDLDNFKAVNDEFDQQQVI